LNNVTFLLTYHIIAHYWVSKSDSINKASGVTYLNGNAVLFNRWSESVDIDESNYTTRTRRGKYVIRSDNNLQFTPDDLRGSMGQIGVPEGFKRARSHYRESPDGLGIEYEITDKEVFKQPPFPAFEADGEYAESTTRKGMLRWGQARCKLKGAKDTPQAKLITTAVGVCASKLLINGADTVNRGLVAAAAFGQGGFSNLEHAVIVVNMYRNEVECSMKAMMLPLAGANGKGRVFGAAGIRFADMVVTPLSPPKKDPPPNTLRGTGRVVLKAAAYYDPSLQKTFIDPATDQLTAGKVPGTVGVLGE
jgi:hypothetical protein